MSKDLMSVGDHVELYGKPAKIFAEFIEDEAYKQFVGAMSLDCVVKGALMPDAHTGYTLPIGAVVASEGVVFPSFVGYDIGCGMCALPTTFRREHVKEKSQKIFNEIYRSVPTGLGGQNLQPVEWDYSKYPMTDRMLEIFKKNGLLQLGSLGGGNHFIEIGYDEDDSIWIVIHSGSRNVGHATATHYMKRASGDGKAREGFFGLKASSEEGAKYIMDLNFCLEFALENRLEMMRRVAQVVHKNAIGRANWEGLINRNHNHAELKDGLWIHRKGATHAENGMAGVIPGNMRDGSFIVEGKGNELALWSSSHGAGRIMGRKEAKNSTTLCDFKKEMGGIVAKVDNDTLDESPFAYKDINDVMRLQADLVTVKHHITPMINAKGGK
jgi:tRNA-splicing ligase RtcB